MNCLFNFQKNPSTSPCNSLPAPYTPTKQTLKNWLHSEISFFVSRANMAETAGIEERQ